MQDLYTSALFAEHLYQAAVPEVYLLVPGAGFTGDAAPEAAGGLTAGVSVLLALAV